MNHLLRTLWIGTVAALALLLAACGSSGESQGWVAVTIDEIGVTSLAPKGATEKADGGFTYESADFGFGAVTSSLASDPNENEFEPVEQLSAGGRPWNLFDLEADGLIVRLAVTEIGNTTYYVVLQAPPTLVDEYAESVLQPALEAFEVEKAADTYLAPVDGDLQELLDDLLAGTDLPSLGVMVFDGEQIIESAVTGVRRRGDPTPVEPTDLFHLGSNTKAMTATLVATYVDDGMISWETTVEDIFGDVIPGLDNDLAQVTLRQLLSHTAGFDAGEDERTFLPLLGIDDDLSGTERRFEIAANALTRPAHHPAGPYEYSNVGYTIVGAMLEELTGTPWEELVRARLFDVLGMESCGFYAPGTPGELDQPWGHVDEGDGQPLDPGDPDADLPHAIAPAGTVHCSMSDWALFLQSQLRGFQGSDTETISPDAFVALQTPPDGSDYALGWGIVEAPKWLAITHNGSNHRFTSEAWLVPGENWGVLVVTNLGKDMASPTVSATVEAMITRHLSP